MSGKGKRRRRAARIAGEIDRVAGLLADDDPSVTELAMAKTLTVKIDREGNTVIYPELAYEYGLFTAEERRQIREAHHPDRFLEQLWHGDRR